MNIAQLIALFAIETFSPHNPIPTFRFKFTFHRRSFWIILYILPLWPTEVGLQNISWVIQKIIDDGNTFVLMYIGIYLIGSL